MYEGELIRLRAYKKEEINQILEYVNDPEIKRFTTPMVPYPFTYEDEEKWLNSNSALNHTYSFAIESLNEGKYVGGCGINIVDWKNSNATLGIFIGDKNYWSKGFGTDAMTVLIKFVFYQMNIRKVKLSVYAFNERAIKCYEKCGFKKEGVLRDEIFKDGRYYDEIIMGILRDEYGSM